MDWILDNIWFLLFLIWGFPLGIYRSKFRKWVYQTDSWTINIKPIFVKELKALFQKASSEEVEFVRFQKFYRFYLVVYMILWIAYISLEF
ncbi:MULTISPECIES: hypothetical protein [unclassified Lentimicrobium]|uniref:hypothetical protein n=1 Tax=unclassified Lentimicrobium TaxID=2677434 RepID=UPI001557EA50|nr:MULTISPECIES: hypothetical protein [unclassified Lentimicrobium]NPD45996.1 hypothetical protein [Lentimicrobium sp. S6]NPD85195.1 hypothetical protein [Lentimicrobium sp. L6]